MKYLNKDLVLELLSDLGPGDAYAAVTNEFLALQKEFEEDAANRQRKDKLRKAMIEYAGQDMDCLSSFIEELDYAVANYKPIKEEKTDTNPEVKVRVVKNGIRDIEEEDRILRDFLVYFK